jgi:hypothetical protein
VTASSDDVLARSCATASASGYTSPTRHIVGAIARLVGDDQQLAAIGAGGALREIEACHGAVRLSELHRCADPAEAAAALAARDGRTEALGIYLGPQRVHVGDPTPQYQGVGLRLGLARVLGTPGAAPPSLPRA